MTPTSDDWRTRALKAETTVARLTAEIERHREDAARLVASEQETRRERDRLARGEATPSLDAIRAHEGAWLWTYSDDGTYGGKMMLTLTDDGRVWAIGAERTYWTPEEFAAHHKGRRWWRVRDDGTLDVAEHTVLRDTAPSHGEAPRERP